MRYISKYDDLQLIDTKGDPMYKFKNGELVVGDATTKTGAGNFIDPASFTYKDGKTYELTRVFPADLAGATTAAIEMCGQGSLADPLGTPLGLRGFFFEAPVLTAGTDTVVAKAKVPYKVLSGTVTYAGVTYQTGTEFVADGTTTATTGVGTYALAIPKIDWFPETKQLFKDRHLIDGNEARDYWVMTRDGGYVPRGEFTTTDIATGYGYMTP